MKKAIFYFIAVLMLASIPAMDLMASRASHGDWYFREEWGGTQYSAYVAGNCRYQVLPEGKKETIVSAFKDVMHEITKYHR